MQKTRSQSPLFAPLMMTALIVLTGASLGCRSLSYDEPDQPPIEPRVTVSKSLPKTGEIATWSAHANAARESLRIGDLAGSEREFMACLAATETFDSRDVRRLTSLAIPSGLVERHQAAGRNDEAARIMDIVLAEGQGGVAFPVNAWAHAIMTRLEVDRLQKGPEAELELAQQISEIHLGPVDEATVMEVTLRQRVGRLLVENDETAAGSVQLGWAARAAQPMLRLGLEARLGLLFEAASASTAAGDPTTSDFLLREAVELARTSDREGFRTAAALNQRGWFLTDQGRPHAAVPVLEEARDLAQVEGAPPMLAAAILDTLAVALQQSGRLDDAAETIDQAIAARANSSPEEQAALSVLDEHRVEIERDRAAAGLPASSDEAPAQDTDEAPAQGADAGQ